jgi:hypothetical protein
MYHGDPMAAPAAVRDFSAPPAMIAIPKSMMRARPLLSTNTFEGLMSRWTSPLACANLSPLRMSRTMGSASDSASFPFDLMRTAQVLAVHILHDQKELTRLFEKVGDLDDIRIVQERLLLRLIEEPSAEIGFAAQGPG